MEKNKKEEIVNKKRRKLSKRAYNSIRVVAICVAALSFMYASYELTNSFLDYKSAEAKYDAIDNMFLQTETAEAVTNKDGKEDSIEYSAALTKWKWDYDAMLKYNDESKGYIKLDKTRIQYPIVQHKDNDFYLDHGSDKIYNGGGSVFIDSRIGGLENSLCIIYGHNMLDGSMFKDLMKYSDDNFCKKNQVFDIYVGYRHYRYYVFSSFRAKDVNEDVYKFAFKDNNDFAKWISTCLNKSNYKYDCEPPTTSDKVIMCSTCVDDYGNRMLVCMYRGEEVVD